MTPAPPIRYRDDLETVDAAAEAETHRQLDEQFQTILETTAKDYGHAVRSVHAKAHGLFVGTLSIDDGLAPHLAQGVFATPGTHDAIVRLSTNPGDIIDDAVSVPRGVALKILDVAGERLPRAEGSTQDFIFVNSTHFTAKSSQAFLGNLKMLAKTTDVGERAKVALSKTLQTVNAALGAVGIESSTIGTLGGAPQSEPLGETYYSATPFRYGEYVAKFRLRPLAPEQIALAGETIDLDGDRDGIRHRIQDEARGFDQRWEFAVQLLRDTDAQPIEDASQEWPEDVSPFERVGEVVLPAQDSWDADVQAQVNEAMRFGIWTGLAAHRPLGDINRARDKAYRHSADFRARVNGCPIHEPTRAPEPATAG